MKYLFIMFSLFLTYIHIDAIDFDKILIDIRNEDFNRKSLIDDLNKFEPVNKIQEFEKYYLLSSLYLSPKKEHMFKAIDSIEKCINTTENDNIDSLFISQVIVFIETFEYPEKLILSFKSIDPRNFNESATEWIEYYNKKATVTIFTQKKSIIKNFRDAELNKFIQIIKNQPPETKNEIYDLIIELEEHILKNSNLENNTLKGTGL